MKTNLFLTFILGIFVLVSLSSFSSSSTINGWEKLGQRLVNRTIDHDVIMVTKMEGSFSKLKIKVRRSGINMDKMVVHYGNGESQNIEIRENILKGGESRVIDLTGNKRVINRVEFWYDTKGGAMNDKALVELWGRH